MNPKSKYDPWGPIASTLYEINDSDLVQNAIGLSGIPITYQTLDERDGSSHKTRIRAYKPLIQAAYDGLPDAERGRFAQIVAKAVLTREARDDTKKQLIGRLNDIGWTIKDDGVLITQDALVSEQFFPPGTQYDAYVAIREMLSKATTHIMMVNSHMGDLNL